MNRIPYLLFALALACSGCKLSTGDGGGGNGGNGGGGGTEPPGDAGTEAGSLLTNPLSAICETYGGLFALGSSGGKLLTSDDMSSLIVLDGVKRDVLAAACGDDSSATKVWFAGELGKIFFYNGTTLEEEDSGVDKALRSLFWANSSDLFAVGNEGTILHRSSGGTWSEESSGVTVDLYGIGGTASLIYAVGPDRTVLKSLGGGSWSAVTIEDLTAPGDTQFNAVWTDSITGKVFLVGNGGVILQGTAGSNPTWVRASSPTSQNLHAVHGTSETNVFAVGDGGALLHYDGSTWEKQENPEGSTYALHGILVRSETEAYAVGSDGTASDANGVVFRYNGTDWELWYY